MRIRTGHVIFLIALTTLLALGVIWKLISHGGPGAPDRTARFQKGMNYITWSKDRYLKSGSDESLADLAKAGNEWVGITVTWYQDNCATTDIFPTEKTPSDESLAHAIETIHKLGMKVMLKPHLDLLETAGGAWRGEIYCGAEEDWERWFENYADFIQYYAVFAQEYGVEIYCIGVELSSIATSQSERWVSDVIRPIRNIYTGALTYAANWDGEYRKIKFWNELDYVGIDAYFPLSDKKRPDLKEIMEGWKRWEAELDDFQKSVGMPIVFTEVGYCSAAGAAETPWEEIVIGRAEIRLQADLYEALFRTFWDKPWFYGVYWWRWGTDVRAGGPSNKSFPPQNKKAREVLEKWYAKPTPSRDLSKL